MTDASLVLDSLTEGVTLENPVGTFGGWPYAAEFSTGSLFRGLTAEFVLQLSNPTGGTISFVPLVYAGTL